MRKSVLMSMLLLVLVFASGALLAKSDTVFYDSGAVRWVKHLFDDDRAEMSVWYEDGSPMCKVRLIKKQDWYVDGSSTVFNEDGSVYQTYDHELGQLCTYEKNSLIARTTVPLFDTTCLVEEFFYSGQLKTHEISRHDTGAYCLKLASGYSTQKCYIYQYLHNQNIEKKQFHSNGQVWSVEEYTGVPPHFYETKYYSPSGELDTLTSKCHERKCGIRYAYHNNGNLQTITNYHDFTNQGWYENGKREYRTRLIAEQDRQFHRWYEDARLKEVSFTRKKKPLGPFLSFHPNGAINRIGSKYSPYSAEMMSCYNDTGMLEWENIGLPNYFVGNQDFRDNASTKSTFTYSGNFANGVRDGKWVCRYANGNVCYEATYADSVLHGPFVLYYEDGQLMGLANYKDGWLDGSYLALGKEGDTLAIGAYNKMKKQGPWKTYFGNGNLQRVEEYENDQQSMVWKEYYENGQLAHMKEKPKDGKQRSKGFHDNGALYSIVIHDLNGGIDDKTFYRRDGTLDRTHKPKNGMPEVEITTRYFENGKKWAQNERVGRKTHGAAARWNEQGVLLEEGNYAYGRKDGPWKSYDENGDLLVVQYFSEGKELYAEKQQTEMACSCYEKDMQISSGMPTSAELYMEDDTLQFTHSRFSLSAAVQHLFFERIQRNSVVAITNRNIEVPIKNTGGLVLDLTPCRKFNNFLKAHIGYYRNDYFEKEYNLYFNNEYPITPFTLFGLMQQIYECDYNYARFFKGMNRYFGNPQPLVKFLSDSGYVSNLDSLENEDYFNELFESQAKNLTYDDWSFHQDLFKALLEPELKNKALEEFMNDFFMPLAAIPHEQEVDYSDDYDSTYTEIYYEYLPSFDEVVFNIVPEYILDIDIRHFGLKFPRTMIVPVNLDTGNGSAIEALFPVSDFQYTSKNFGDIAFTPSDTSCMPAFRLAGTSLTFASSQPQALLTMGQLYRHTDIQLFPGLDSLSREFTDIAGRQHDMPYLDCFTGIYLDSVEVVLHHNNKQIQLVGAELIMDGNTLCGQFILKSKEQKKEQVEKILTDEGFSIYQAPDDTTGQKTFFLFSLGGLN